MRLSRSEERLSRYEKKLSYVRCSYLANNITLLYILLKSMNCTCALPFFVYLRTVLKTLCVKNTLTVDLQTHSGRLLPPSQRPISHVLVIKSSPVSKTYPVLQIPVHFLQYDDQSYCKAILKPRNLMSLCIALCA